MACCFMTRDKKIEKLANEIQLKINELKKLNCSLSGYIGGLGVVDYNIETDGEDDNSDIIYTFDTAFHN